LKNGNININAKKKAKERSMNEVILILSEDGTYKRDIAVFHDNGDTSRFHGYGKWKADKDSLYFYDSYSICNVCQNKNQLVSNKTYQIKKSTQLDYTF